MSEEQPRKYQRHVFGRRDFEDQGEVFKVELRADGLYILQPNSGQWIFVSPAELACRGRCQYEFPFAKTLAAYDALRKSMEQSQQTEPVPDMQPRHVVPGGAGQGVVHASGEQPAQDPEVGRSGVDTPNVSIQQCPHCGEPFDSEEGHTCHPADLGPDAA